MFEHSTHPLLAWPAFLRRASLHIASAFTLLLIGVGIGTLGYLWIAGLGPIDSLLNATMILTGMGPVDRMNTDGAKLFASGYALLSGFFFAGAVGLAAAPWLHRLLHWMHIEAPDQ